MKRKLIESLFAACAALALLVVPLTPEPAYSKAADFREENAETINVSTSAEKTFYEPITVVPEAYEQDTAENVAEDPEEAPVPEWFEVVATAYCPNSCCCAGWSAVAYKATASGWGAKENWTIAADEAYTFGTILFLEGLGERMVMDRGSAITGNRIDVYFETHEEACAFGMQTLRAYVVK